MSTVISREDLELALIQRHGPLIFNTLKNAHVGIAGLGGLGSNIAVMLTRLGIDCLTLADFDNVDISNLNRQHYMQKHLGQPKTLALAGQLQEINPYIKLELYTEKITETNAGDIFRDCSIVCEAFDQPEAKAELINTLLDTFPRQKIIGASGLAGYGSSNDIKTRKVMKNFYLCGDGHSGIENGLGLMAPRALLCAAHQANMVLRLLLGIDDV